MAKILFWFASKSVQVRNIPRYFSTSSFNGSLCSNAGKICINGTSGRSSKVFMVDEPLDIVINGLQPNKNVTLRAISMTGGGSNTLFQSFAHYEADCDGSVRVKDLESKGGTYRGVAQMGLFWSMVPLKNEDFTQMRLWSKDIHTPEKCKLELYDDVIDFGVETFADVSKLEETVSPVDWTTIERWHYSRHDVVCETVKTGRIRGEVFYPKNGGKHQGVIDLFGSAGGLISHRAALLASHGFTTYALPYFGFDDLPKDANSLDIEYFEEAVEWFLQHPNVKDNGVGIIAMSFGVSPALILATRPKNKVKGTVCINGCDWVMLHPLSVDGKKLII